MAMSAPQGPARVVYHVNAIVRVVVEGSVRVLWSSSVDGRHFVPGLDPHSRITIQKLTIFE